MMGECNEEPDQTNRLAGSRVSTTFIETRPVGVMPT